MVCTNYDSIFVVYYEICRLIYAVNYGIASVEFDIYIVSYLVTRQLSVIVTA